MSSFIANLGKKTSRLQNQKAHKRTNERSAYIIEDLDEKNKEYKTIY